MQPKMISKPENNNARSGKTETRVIEVNYTGD